MGNIRSKNNNKTRQNNIETALVIGGAVLIILAIVFLIAVFNVYTSDCSEYISEFIRSVD